MMTDKERIQQLEDLLQDVLHSLDMTLYHIGDPSESGVVARDINTYWKKFADIRYATGE